MITMGLRVFLDSLNSPLSVRGRYFLYIGLCLLCKVILIIGDEKVSAGIQTQTQNKNRDNSRKGREEVHGILREAPAKSNGLNSTADPRVCDNETLVKCMAKMPPLPDFGIPSTPQGVENACKTFNNGMDCVYSYASKCITKEAMEKLNNSVLGAHEMFTFLCRDSAFRQDFLQHSKCYRQISRHWDECAKSFILTIKSLSHHETSKDLCCIRIAFLQCLMDVTHRFCTINAAKFIQLMGETLIRSTMRGHAPKQCSAVSLKDCPMLHHTGTNSAPSEYETSLFTDLSIPTITILTCGYMWRIAP